MLCSIVETKWVPRHFKLDYNFSRQVNPIPGILKKKKKGVHISRFAETNKNIYATISQHIHLNVQEAVEILSDK